MKLLRDIAANSAALAGAALLSYGAALAWFPAGFIVGGVLLICAAWLLADPTP